MGLPTATSNLDLVRSLGADTVLDCRGPLDAIAEAHRYVERGHKNGNAIITIPD